MQTPVVTDVASRQDPGQAVEGLVEHAAPPSVLSDGWLRAATVGFALVLAAGIVLRFWTRSSLWLDEALTVDIARQPLHTLPGALKRDGAPPLYYVLLHFWMGPFGTSDIGTRSLSAVLSIASMPVAWLAGRRLGGRSAAWIATVLLASAPFAIYYATEARMYALVMLLTACGFLALDRVLNSPSIGNVVALGVVTAALLYSQYWALYLIGVLGLWLLWRSRRAFSNSANARWALLGVSVGSIAFVPWVPTFLYQSQHTGTPWAAPPNFSAIISAVTGFADNQATLTSVASNQGRLLALAYFLFAFLALFGMARDRWHIELDIRTRPRARGLSFIVVGTLVVAVGGGIATKSAFTPRYAAVVFIPLLLLVAFGALTIVDARIRAALMAVAALAGLALSVENVYTQRTQGKVVADVLLAHTAPGDVVAFCPDQVGPAVYRFLPSDRFTLITYPRRTSPEFVDWVDYKDVIAASGPVAFATHLEALAGHRHGIWFISAPGYEGYGTRCAEIGGALLGAPGYGGHNWVTADPTTYYEPMGLTEFQPPQAAPPTSPTR